MTPTWPALLALGGALLVWSPGVELAARRLRALRGAGGRRPERSGGASSPGLRRLLAGAAGLGAALLVGGLPGLAAGTVVAVLGDRWLRTTGPAPDGDRAAVTRELPATCDLLAVCLAAGVPVVAALASVGAAVPAPIGTPLSGVAALCRLGAEPRRAWADVPAELAPLGRVLVRAGESGAAAVPALRALAADSRAAVRAATEDAVRRAGIWVLAPLGLCFLPAFVCLGVVPMVLGIAGDVFG